MNVRTIGFALVFLSASCFAEADGSDYEKALVLFAEDKFAEAEISVKNSLQENPNYLPARLLLGNILLAQGQLEAAEKEFTLSITMRADSYIVVLPLVETKLLLDKPQEAIDLLAKYQQLKGEKTYFLLQGNALKALEQYKEAGKAYQLALDLHGDSAVVYTAVADLAYKMGDATLAVSKADSALTVDN